MIDPLHTLRSGPFQLFYENGLIRRICYGNHEILRMIYFALRDENWVTLPFVIQDEKIETHPDSFRISFIRTDRKNETDIFRWKASVEGDHTGQITFEIEGKALTSLKKNRAGFCILHPVSEVAGQEAEIHHPEGTVTFKKFPVLVSPVNPFKNIRSMRWACQHKEFELHMEGDIFETEDQRNWTDASYKTFCTPSNLPVPVSLSAGETVYQKVVFRPLTAVVHPAYNIKPFIKLETTGTKVKLPSIGIGASTEERTLKEGTISDIKALRLDHYRIEVAPGRPQWVTDYSHDYQQGFSLGLPLFVALHLSEKFQEELEAFITLSLQNRVRIKYILLLSKNKPVTEQGAIDYGTDYGKKLMPKVMWGAGTDYNFVDVNQKRFNPFGLDFISYAIHPQEHTFDDLSLIENLQGQTDTAKSAANIYPYQAICISPVTLRKRFNPAATEAAERILTNEQKSDPRQVTSFAAHWTFGSLRSLAEGRAHSCTYFQTAGSQGLISSDGERLPVYELLMKLLPHRQKELFVLKNSHPHLVDAMLFEQAGSRLLWLVNHSHIGQTILFEKKKIDLAHHETRLEFLHGT